jgi:hypothetical protein
MKRNKTNYELLIDEFPKIKFPFNQFIDNENNVNSYSNYKYHQSLPIELEVLDMLNASHTSDIIPHIFKSTPRFSELDIIGSVENLNIFIEIKTRYIRFTDYMSTIIPISKVNYYKKLRDLNKETNNILIFIISFIDPQGEREYYYIQFKNKQFREYDKMQLPNGLYFIIPTSHLIPIRNFTNIKLI